VVAELDRSIAAVAPSTERAIAALDRTTAHVTQGMERAVTQLERSTAVADQAVIAAERAQDQLSRELGASRQLLSLLAAGLGTSDTSHGKPRHANGPNGANGTSAAREA
jgi:hypothetical protein